MERIRPSIVEAERSSLSAVGRRGEYSHGSGASEMLQLILREVNRMTGTEVIAGRVPFSLLARTMVREGASQEMARAVLLRTLSVTGRKLSWQLFCQPLGKTCALNIHIVERRGA